MEQQLGLLEWIPPTDDEVRARGRRPHPVRSSATRSSDTETVTDLRSRDTGVRIGATATGACIWYVSIASASSGGQFIERSRPRGSQPGRADCPRRAVLARCPGAHLEQSRAQVHKAVRVQASTDDGCANAHTVSAAAALLALRKRTLEA